MCKDSDAKPKLPKEQYTQYHEMRRQYNAFSWQIPSAVAALIVLLFIASGPKKIDAWILRPLFPCVGFFMVSVFTLVMIINHGRNILFLRRIEDALIDMEQCHGRAYSVYSHQMDTDLNISAYRKIKSSSWLGIFLLVVFVCSLLAFMFFGALLICPRFMC